MATSDRDIPGGQRPIDLKLPDQLAIAPVSHPAVGSIRPPGSKSITNRALLCAAFAEGPSELLGALDSEDTKVMVDSLKQLGLRVEHVPAKEAIALIGAGGMVPNTNANLFV